MSSAIDPTKPADGVPAVKSELRANLQAAKNEIEALQASQVPTGGTTGQVLSKLSATNFDTGWQTPTGGSGWPPTNVIDVGPPSGGNDAPAIQAALVNDRVVWFRPGANYRVSSSIARSDLTRCKVMGNGARITALNTMAQGAGPIINLVRPVDCWFEDLIVDGNRAARGTIELFGGNNWNVDGGQDCVWRGCTSKNAVTDGWHLRCEDPFTHATMVPKRFTLLDCHADNNSRQGVSIVYGYDFQIIGGSYNNTNGLDPGAGIDIEPGAQTLVGGPNSQRHIIMGASFVGNAGAAVEFHEAGNNNVAGIMIGCHVEDCGKGPKGVDPWKYLIRAGHTPTIISGCTFRNCTVQGGNGALYDFAIQLDITKKCIFSDNYVENCTAWDNFISGWIAGSPNDAALWKIEGNLFNWSAGGIRNSIIRIDTHNAIVRNNEFIGAAELDSAIRIDSDSHRAIIDNNQFRQLKNGSTGVIVNDAGNNTFSISMNFFSLASNDAAAQPIVGTAAKRQTGNTSFNMAAA
jgi:hypothetical protein